mmetsp:Transcript_27074/g.64429  ORF Transcript_27074/g.64429 Transcript_27074/m.64429 type:complete len:493 (-) Transcript_27074:124-1602(-)
MLSFHGTFITVEGIGDQFDGMEEQPHPRPRSQSDPCRTRPSHAFFESSHDYVASLPERVENLQNMIGVPREPSTDADEPEGRSITSEVSDLPALVSDLPAPTEATSLTSHSHPNEEMQHNLSVLQEILNHMECALRISSAEVASFQKAQTNGQDGQSAFRRIESIRDRLVTSLPTGASDARQQLQQHVEILRETQSVTVQHLAEFLAKVQQIMGKMLETMVLELQEAASQMREARITCQPLQNQQQSRDCLPRPPLMENISESQAAVSGPNMARVNPCGSNQAMTGSDFSTFPGSGTEMPFPASSDGWTHYPTASSDLGSNASAQSAERTEGAAQMGVSLPVNPGSVGHRELCAKPCLFFRTGACTGRDSCPFCHGEHAERRPHLDKRNRELFKGLPTNVRTQLLLQAMKCRADTIGEFADKLMEVVETAIEVQLQPNRRWQRLACALKNFPLSYLLTLAQSFPEQGRATALWARVAELRASGLVQRMQLES